MQKQVLVIGALIILAIGSIMILLQPGSHETIEPTIVDQGKSGERSWSNAGASANSDPVEVPKAELSPDDTREADKPEATDDEGLKEQLAEARREIEALAAPLNQDMLSSTVHAEISENEVLVTGGYPIGDDAYEFTFISPRKVTLPDGQEAIAMDAHVLVLNQDFIEENNMRSIATNARNTLQHAEAWTIDEATAAWSAAEGHDGANLLSAPSILSLPGSDASVSIAQGDGGPSYTLDINATPTLEGGFALRSRIVRFEESQ
ncbi:MAG: hypothetical protein AAFX93_03730 [Verrucomicrobiota bacterium]